MASKNIYNVLNDMLDNGKINKWEHKRIMKEIKKTKYLNSISKRGKSKDIAVIKDATFQVMKDKDNKDEYNSAVISHIMNINKIVKPILDEPNSIAKCVNTYFALCKSDSVRPSVSGLSMAIGVSRMTLLKWANGETRLQNQEIITQALQMIEIFVETSMETGKMNPIPAVFLLKNNHGYHDTTTIKVDGGVKELSAEEIRKKYMEETNIIEADYEDK